MSVNPSNVAKLNAMITLISEQTTLTSLESKYEEFDSYLFDLQKIANNKIPTDVNEIDQLAEFCSKGIFAYNVTNEKNQLNLALLPHSGKPKSIFKI